MQRLPALICLFLLLLVYASSSHAQAPPFILKWGSPGSGDGQFDFPRRIAVASDGTVYVSDRNNARVQKFTSTGGFITKWGSLGSAAGQFDFPFGIAVDTGHNFIYTAERNNNRIQKFSVDGTFLLEWGSFGAGDGEFNFPIAIDVDPQGNVYVGDSFNHRIQKFDADGQFITKWGSQGSPPGQFVNPIGIAVDAAGRVYVGDSGNHRIQKFASNGAFLTSWGSQGSGDGEFQSPRGVGVDPDGNIYVADTINSRIQKFTNTGVFLAKWGSFGSGNGQFNRPEDAEVDGDGNVYVADPSNNRIQKFGFESVAVTLSAFSAEREGQAAVIRWQVSSHAIDDVVFDVLRESNGGQRRVITPQALGGRDTYVFTDVDAPSDAVEYWLHEKADNGNSYMHGPIALAALRFDALRLHAPYPNPFNPSTVVAYSLPAPGHVSIFIVDAGGRLVRQLVAEPRDAGSHEMSWDGRNDRGNAVASGTYFVTIVFAGHIRSQSVTLIK